MISEITENNSLEILEIYKQGIETGVATFESNVPDWQVWDSKHLKHSRLGYFEGEKLLGWAALTPYSSRSVYSGVAEVSVYVANSAKGKGVGKKLINALIESSEQNGVWTLVSGILKDNEASIALHLKCGFRLVGVREKIAKLNGVWKDTVIMERRSKVII